MEGSTGPAALAGGCPADMRLSEEVLEEKDSLGAGWLIGMRALSGLSSLSTLTEGCMRQKTEQNTGAINLVHRLRNEVLKLLLHMPIQHASSSLGWCLYTGSMLRPYMLCI